MEKTLGNRGKGIKPEKLSCAPKQKERKEVAKRPLPDGPAGTVDKIHQLLKKNPGQGADEGNHELENLLDNDPASKSGRKRKRTLNFKTFRRGVTEAKKENRWLCGPKNLLKNGILRVWKDGAQGGKQRNMDLASRTATEIWIQTAQHGRPKLYLFKTWTGESP